MNRELKGVVQLGSNLTARHDFCIMLGTNLTTTRSFQLVVGSEENNTTVVLNQYVYTILYTTLDYAINTMANRRRLE